MADKTSPSTLYDLISQLIDIIIRDRVSAAPGGGLAEAPSPSGRALSLASPALALARSGPSGVPAMAGATPGSAPVMLQSFDGATLSPTRWTPAFNVSSRPVAPDRPLVLGLVDGRWFVLVEACG